MSIVSVRIPQIGEGLQEARLVATLKQPGDRIARDEPIYQMETDKAVMDVESPHEGVLIEWLAEIDALLPIGAEVARIEVAAAEDGTIEPSHPTDGVAVDATPETGATTDRASVVIPPRTRAYAKEKGIADDVLALIPAAGGKLMPSDIDGYLAAPAAGYVESPLPPKQRLLAARLVRGSQLVVPGTMTVVTRWESIENARARNKKHGGPFQPSAFTMFAYAVMLAVKKHPMFRSTLIGDDVVRTYDHVSLGIAVGLPNDELVLAVVEEADTLTWEEFAQRMRDRIELARTGKDQANEAVTISLTNMQSFGLHDAVPVVVPPAVATLFLGAPYADIDPTFESVKIRRVANMALTFDHRIMNGVGAAQFMSSVRQNVETIGTLID